MKKSIVTLVLIISFFGCKTANIISYKTTKKQEIVPRIKTINRVDVAIDLINVQNDKVLVSINAPVILTDETIYSIPKIIPGTYSEDNYGTFIENLKAFDSNGLELSVTKKDTNSWSISNAKTLDKITYLVNDTFDVESTHEIFSPAGSNISPENYLVNTHCFIGSFSNFMELPYRITISHPSLLWGATSMTDIDASTTTDIFETNRYAQLVENPVMYSKPNYTTFDVNGMEILIAVFSPNNRVTAEMITPEMKKVMTAQKKFLGNFNSTKKYSVLIYLSDIKTPDAHGFGALEHPTATTVVLPEIMGIEQLSEALKDVVSHEFFHIVTPLSIHSLEIQNFNYGSPIMSEHLWLYEGVTEYFANLFQINQGLISEGNFYKRMTEKIEHANAMNDKMPFTTMSKNVIVEPYKAQYNNVYEKGALIGMCLDIIIREKSNGEHGILDLMRNLSLEYGVNKAFSDSELFDKITQLTYPEVGIFLKTYVSGITPIPYLTFLEKMGITKLDVKKGNNPFFDGQKALIKTNKETKEISVISDNQTNDFLDKIGLQTNDIITSINNKKYNFDNLNEMISVAATWKQGEYITIDIKRNGKQQMLKGKVKLTYQAAKSFQATDLSKTKLKETWLKN